MLLNVIKSYIQTHDFKVKNNDLLIIDKYNNNVELTINADVILETYPKVGELIKEIGSLKEEDYDKYLQEKRKILQKIINELEE